MSAVNVTRAFSRRSGGGPRDGPGESRTAVSSASGADCDLRLLELPDPPTAIFSANNTMSLGVLQALHERGLARPPILDRRVRRRAVAGRNAAAADVHRPADVRHRRHRGAPPARAHRRAEPAGASRRARDLARRPRVVGPAARPVAPCAPGCFRAVLRRLTSGCAAWEPASGRAVVALVMKSLANEFFKTMEEARDVTRLPTPSDEPVATGIKDEQDVSRQIGLVEQMSRGACRRSCWRRPTRRRWSVSAAERWTPGSSW